MPDLAGVYQVTVPELFAPTFLEESPASWHKGRCPTVTIDRLEKEWVPGAQTIYVGTASKSLRQRILSYVRSGTGGRGSSGGHWGGRLVWQLDESDCFEVAWQIDERDPECHERHLVEEFKDAYGVLPFANLNLPSKCKKHRG